MWRIADRSSCRILSRSSSTATSRFPRARIFAAVWAGVRVANATDESAMLSGRTYEVRAGDTLWQIATEQYDGTLDPRAVVYEIREANGLHGALLQPGETLTLPYIGP